MMGEPLFKIVKWMLGPKSKAMSRLRSLTPLFFGTPSKNQGDTQGNVRGIPGCGVAFPVDLSIHDGAAFIGADAMPAEYIHEEKKVYLLDKVGVRHDGKPFLAVGKNVELAIPLYGDAIGIVDRGAEYGTDGLKRNIFHPTGAGLIAHHLAPEPPKESTHVFDVDGRHGGIHYQWFVRRWIDALCGGATAVARKIYAPLLNMTRNGDGTPAHGAAHFAAKEAVLSHEAYGPLRPSSDKHNINHTGESPVAQGAIDVDRAIFSDGSDAFSAPLLFSRDTWVQGSQGPIIKDVQIRMDFAAVHQALCGPKKGYWKLMTWADWGTFPTYPRITEPKEGPPIDRDPDPDPKPKTFVNPTINTPDHRINGVPTTGTPNEVAMPSEYGHPVPGTPEPRGIVDSAPDGASVDGGVGGADTKYPGHDFTPYDHATQPRVGHSVYLPVYQANTAGAGNTGAQRWPTQNTKMGAVYIGADGRIAAIDPATGSGSKITLAPEMERFHAYVANKETWPTNLSATSRIIGAGKNAADVELVGVLGLGLRVPNTYLPASGFYIKLDYTDDAALPDVDIRTTDADGLDASTGRKLMFNGTDLSGPIATVVTAASAFAAAQRVPVAGGNDRTLKGSDFTATSDGSYVLAPAAGVTLSIQTDPSSVTTIGGTLASGAHTMAEQAAPSTPAAGHVVIYPKSDGLMYSKDDGGVETALGGGSGSSVRTVSVQFGGPGGSISANDTVWVRVPYTGTITKVSLLADTTGSIVIDVWKDTYANYPPTVADTIAAAAKPTLSSANKSEDSTLTGWTTAVTAGDVLKFNVDSVSGLTQVSLLLEITV